MHWLWQGVGPVLIGSDAYSFSPRLALSLASNDCTILAITSRCFFTILLRTVVFPRWLCVIQQEVFNYAQELFVSWII